MRKSVKKLVGAVLAAVLCVMMVPAQTVKAEENVEDVMTTVKEMSEEQLLSACMGTWWECYGEAGYFPSVTLSKESFEGERFEIEWSYVGIVEVMKEATEDVSEEYIRALHFTNEEHEYYIHLSFWDNDDGVVDGYLNIVCCGKGGIINDSLYSDAAKYLVTYISKAKETEAGEGMGVVQVLELIAAQTETVKEEKQEVVKQEISTREVLEGESVYIVKKGDCLWGIARTLLGDGRRYKELYTRNNDIVEKAELIYVGQEIIVPAK